MLASLFRAEGAEDRSPFGEFWFQPVGGRSAAGVRVTPESSMRLTAVYRAVSLIAGARACMPFVLYRRKTDGGKNYITDDWRYRLFAKRPNRWQNPFEWASMMQGHLSLRGNGYNEIRATGGGEVAELVPLHPDRVAIEVFDSGDYRYKYTERDGRERPIPRGNMFHLRGLSSDGIKGYNPIELAADAVGAGLAAQHYGAQFFRNDARPSGGWIELPPGMKFKDQAAKDTFMASYQSGQSGEKRGKAAVFENGMKWHDGVAVSNRDAQFLESRQFSVADIGRLFGVQPHLIGDLSRSTNNNIEQQALEFVMYTMTYWAELWEHAIESTFIDEAEDLEVGFDMSNLLRGDMKTRGEFCTQGINAGWLTRNEARISDNRDPLPGLDKPLEPLNMAPAGAKRDPAAGKPPTQPKQDDTPDAEGADARRARELTLAISASLVRKETTVVRKFWQSEERLREFYAKHRDEMAERLACAPAIAVAWCDAHFAELKAAPDLDSVVGAWESTAAAELAARVQMSAQGAA